MNYKKRAVDLEQGIEPGFAVRFQRVVVARSKKRLPLRVCCPSDIEFSLVVSPELIYGLVHEGHDMEPVENNYLRLGSVSRTAEK